MANTKITSLTDIAATPASNDVYVLVDVSDTSMAATGTDKKITANRIVHQDTSGNSSVLGNFGIGTVSPGAKLHVYTGNDEIARFASTSATGLPYISFYQTTTRRSFLMHSDTLDTFQMVSEYGDIAFRAASSAGSDSDTEYMRIKAGGRVGIGTASPGYNLHVVGDMKTTASYFGTIANFYASNTGADALINFDTNDYMTYATSTNVLNYVLGGNLRQTLNSLGHATFSGTVTCLDLVETSQEDLKENIVEVTEDITQKLNSVKLYRYNMKGDNKVNIGLLAEELAQEYPELVADTIRFEGLEAIPTKAINYGKFGAMAFVSVRRLREQLQDAKQQLQQTIQTMNQKINVLETKVAALEAK
jgi:hypothetical protein